MEEKDIDLKEKKEEATSNQQLLEEIKSLKKQIDELDMALWKRKWILIFTCLLGIGNFIMLFYIMVR